MIAIIKTGGKQYIVKPGDKLKIEKLDEKEGVEIKFSDVLLIADDPSTGSGQAKTEIGAPFLKGAEVSAKVLRQDRAEKVIIFKYKSKKRYSRKIGHRQPFTEVEIIGIKN